MDRRFFLKSTVGLGGLVAGVISAQDAFSNPNPQAYDLVAVKGGESDVMLDKALQSMGGIAAFVKKGQRVVIKPNIGWDASPERAANTNPKLIKRLVEHCVTAGASEILVFDNTCDNWQNCYKNSGIEKAVKDAGGKMVPANSMGDYKDVTIPKGKRLKTAKVHEQIINADVFINVPVLKNHSGAKLTMSMKNLMGIVWDRGYWHSNDLHQCIADFASWKKPTLNIVDAYNVMKKNGPKGVSVSDVANMKYLMLSKDMVAIDAAAAKVFGYTNVDDIAYIKIAHQMGIGSKNLDKLSINRINL